MILYTLLQLSLVACVPIIPEVCDDPQRVLNDLYSSSSYDKNLAPPGYPVHVNLSLVIQNVRSVNEIDATASIYVDIIATWYDQRLQHPCKEKDSGGGLPLNKWEYNKIWDPSINIASAMRIEMSHTPLVQVKSTGLVRSIHPYSVVISCFTDFVKFPFDWISCNLGLTSWVAPAYVTLGWENPENPASIMKREMKLAEFALRGKPEMPRDDMGESAFVEYHVILDRLFGYYVLQVYVPSVLTVAVALLSFMMSAEAMNTRISLCISTLIALVLLHGRVVQHLPKVGYIKGIDVWMLGCSIFVFATIAESVLVTFFKRCMFSKKQETPPCITVLDITSMIAFPCAFCGFVVGYAMIWC